ncbi:MAG: M20/M25/M40 family metallo-hydrolase [Clostridia bacterium]|nr:M20/M25/M40 family metallo-hydrolase [Clostridia bacterium]
MQDRIYRYLKELVALDTVSCTNTEYKAGDWFADFFKKMPYFQKHPELTGQFVIPGDTYNRTIPWALILGNTKKTVITSGHYDVVGTDNYGTLNRMAFEMGPMLDAELAKKDLDAEARADMESGEWLWGRGVGDMKGGLAIHLALFEDYAKQAEEGTLPGSYLYMPVPDEESFSVGMREGAKILRHLIEKYELDIKLMVIPEPSNLTNGKQSLSRGTVGKMMPVVMVQGITAHVGHCFNGLSPIGILADIYSKTNNCLDFSDSYDGEAACPPTWQKFRDMKEQYDVTIPLRASGYFTLLCFEKTPEEVITKLREISKQALDENVERINATYQAYKKLDKSADKEKITYSPEVYTFEELCNKLKAENEEAFNKYYYALYADISKEINAGTINFPDATLKIMAKVMDYADLKQPTVLLGFAPPYYPPVNSDVIPGHENAALEAYEIVEKASAKYGVEMYNEHFFMGISDGSYTAMGKPFDYSKFSKNTPAYGDLYSLDFETIEANNIPFILYGPLTKEYHQWTERSLKKSMLEIVPAVTKELFEAEWNK